MFAWQAAGSTPFRVDMRPDEASAIFWVNDIEKDEQYSRFQKSCQCIHYAHTIHLHMGMQGIHIGALPAHCPLTPLPLTNSCIPVFLAFPVQVLLMPSWQLPAVRKNVFNLVFVMDLSTSSALRVSSCRI